MSCSGDGIWFEETESVAVDIEAWGYTSQVFAWRCELDWDYSGCSYPQHYSDLSIDEIDGHAYSVDTHTYWSYEGKVSESDDIDNDETPPEGSYFRQDLYDGDSLFGYPFGAANPFVEFEVDAWGDYELDDHNSDSRYYEVIVDD